MIPTTLPVKIEVITDLEKGHGYNLKHNQRAGWQGIITSSWAWFKYKSDATRQADGLMKSYNASSCSQQ